MNRIQSHFDRISAKRTLNSALTTLTLAAVYSGMWIPQTIKYSRTGDTGGVYLGVASMVIGLSLVAIGWASAHAIVRRLIAQAKAGPSAPPDPANPAGSGQPAFGPLQ